MHDTLLDLLDRSQASPEFKEAVEALLDHRPQDRIDIAGYAPPVKVQRVLCKLLEDQGHLPIERVAIDGRSGCSNFTGRLTLEPGNVVIDFDWDCAWKAQVEGLTMFGIPDQQRAAREFGYDCFRVFEPQGSRRAVGNE